MHKNNTVISTSKLKKQNAYYTVKDYEYANLLHLNIKNHFLGNFYCLPHFILRV